MNTALQQIVDTLAVEQIEKNLYRGENGESGHVFGGQVLAQVGPQT